MSNGPTPRRGRPPHRRPASRSPARRTTGRRRAGPVRRGIVDPHDTRPIVGCARTKDGAHRSGETFAHLGPHSSFPRARPTSPGGGRGHHRDGGIAHQTYDRVPSFDPTGHDRGRPPGQWVAHQARSDPGFVGGVRSHGTQAQRWASASASVSVGTAMSTVVRRTSLVPCGRMLPWMNGPHHGREPAGNGLRACGELAWRTAMASSPLGASHADPRSGRLEDRPARRPGDDIWSGRSAWCWHPWG